ncbi:MULTISPECIES: CsbD family protein [unclassified Mesorhizobium]|uniref:CsbD family protein n=1 Tax=unclassified Mesorhizobium TaxID=325217 RepID=UPI00333D340B
MVNKDQVAGVAKQAKGSVKQAAGKATGNRRTEAEGDVDKATGKMQKAYGDVKDKVKKAL